MKLIIPLIVLGLSALFIGCGSLIEGNSGMTRPVIITTTPPNATIKLNGIPKGRTPISVVFNPYEIRTGEISVSLEGYVTEFLDLRKGLDVKTAGNIFIGGAIGFGVDYLSGATIEEIKSIHIDLINAESH